MQWRYVLLLIVLTLYIPFLYKRFKKGSRMNVIFSIVSIALAVYIGLALLLLVFQARMIFYPYRNHEYRPEDVRLYYESVELITSDGVTLDAWYIPAPDAEYTILFCHGNAGNISHRLDTLLHFRQLGLNCLIFDYRGYGRSGGKPSEQGLYLDVQAAWDWLTNQQQIPPEKIILFGRSLGGSVAAHLAAQLSSQDSPQPAGLVLESCFTSVADMGKHYYPWLPIRWFVRFRFDALAALPQVRMPILIIHSPDDEIVPYKMGKKLFKNAPQPKHFAELSGSHNEGFAENESAYQEIWENFLLNLEKIDP